MTDVRICKVCSNVLMKHHKTTCSWACRNTYVSSMNAGRPSPFRGVVGRFSKESLKKIGDAQRGKPKSEAFKQKCKNRMKGKPSCFKGRKHTEEWKQFMSERLSGENHWKWKNGISSRSDYSVYLRRSKIGFTDDVFSQRWHEQGGRCAICKDILVRKGLKANCACADHCHSTNAPRGILCKKCNSMLGFARDNIDTLTDAIAYLKRWSTKKAHVA